MGDLLLLPHVRDELSRFRLHHQTGRTTPFSTRGAVASLGAFGYELALGNLTAEEKELVRAQIRSYRAVEPLIQTGDLYRISDPFASNLFCVAVVSKDGREGYVVGMQIHAVPADTDHRLRLKGLREDARYEIAELGLTLHGSTLMRAGVLKPSLPDFTSFVWHLKQVG